MFGKVLMLKLALIVVEIFFCPRIGDKKDLPACRQVVTKSKRPLFVNASKAHAPNAKK
jgi:hypothetical protein